MIELKPQKNKVIPSQDRILDVLDYSPSDGNFVWRVSRRKAKAGSAAGAIGYNGYMYIGVDYKLYLAHRLAWLYVHGVWPKNSIDHINGDKSDNRLCNLREASASENLRNRGKQRNNKSGYKGVCFSNEKKRWKAQIRLNNEVKHLGYFETAEEAYAAYCKAAEVMHGEFSKVA